MPQSLSQVYVHLIFSTKYVQPIIQEKNRKELEAYMVGTLSKLKSFTEEIYANPDHVHILCTLSRTMTIADMVSKLKSASSKWIKPKSVSSFSWQDGYGIFSVSASKVYIVKKYIQNQGQHHQTNNFKDELREFFKQYNVAYNEKYVWD